MQYRSCQAAGARPPDDVRVDFSLAAWGPSPGDLGGGHFVNQKNCRKGSLKRPVTGPSVDQGYAGRANKSNLSLTFLRERPWAGLPRMTTSLTFSYKLAAVKVYAGRSILSQLCFPIRNVPRLPFQR